MTDLPSPPENKNVQVFNADAVNHKGYIYTTDAQFSSTLATQRTTDIILGSIGLKTESSLISVVATDFTAFDFGTP